MEFLKTDKKAVAYVAVWRSISLFVIEAALATAAYFTTEIKAIMVFLCVLISVTMLAAVYFVLVRAILLVKTYKFRFEKDCFEIVCRSIGSAYRLTPLHGATTAEKKKYPFIKGLYKIKIFNGGHVFCIRYVSEENYKIITEALK